MKVFISGLSQLDFLAYFGGHVESALEWCETAHFVDTLASSIHATEPQQAVWLYRAPWMLAGSQHSAEQDSEFILDAWLAEQRMLLKSRRAFGDLLLLVNVDRVSALELLARLGVAASEDALLRPVAEPASSAALAKVFEWVAPSYWETFESLESAAWLSQGEPIFRSTLKAPSDSCLFELLNVLQASLTLPKQQALLVAAQDSVAGLEHKLAMSIKSQADRDELLKENESLYLQLHQVQEELESVLLLNEANSAGAERDQVRLAEKEAMLVAAQDSVAGLEHKLAMSIKSQADRDELLKENESLLLQLHQVQEELESVLLANEVSLAGAEQARRVLIAEKEAMASELGQSRELLKGAELRCAEAQQGLAQRGHVLNEQLAELERAQVALTEKEAMLVAAQNSVVGLQDELAKANKSHQADRVELLKENESLLLQLHRVQEDLEHYYSAHQALLEVTASDDSSSVSVTGEEVIEPARSAEANVKGPSRMLALLSAPVSRYVKRNKSEKKFQLMMIFVEQSGYFDRNWYLKTYPDVVNLKIDPVKHYLKFGWEERRDPSARFSTSYYLNTYPDIQASGVNPLVHYIRFGAAEGRHPRAPWGQANSR